MKEYIQYQRISRSSREFSYLTMMDGVEFCIFFLEFMCHRFHCFRSVQNIAELLYRFFFHPQCFDYETIGMQ